MECEIKRRSPYHFGNHSVQYFPLGWHHVLPPDVMDEARERCWRIRIPDFEECANGEGEHPDPYRSDGFLRTLTEIPVQCYSISEEVVSLEKTLKVDLRDFRDMHVFFRYQEQLFGAEDRACRTVLDLFDAMLATKARWKVDSMEELIYLPCIRRPPEDFYRIVKIKRSGKVMATYRTLTESKEFLKLVRNLYPATYIREHVSADDLKEETVKRMKSSRFSGRQFGPEEGMFVTKNWIYYVVPSMMSL